MVIGIISHPDCEKHDVGLDHPERPDRVKVIAEATKSYPFQQTIMQYTSQPISKAQLKTVHDPQYIDWVFTQSPASGVRSLDEDAHMCPDTLSAALLSAGAAPLAVDLVMQGECDAVFCNTRPPGHHAEYHKAMGFCFFNNIAIAATHAMQQHGLKRVAIVDFDVHHGNGTQHIFQNNPDVLFCSSFEHPYYPGYDEDLDNAHIINVPLVTGTTGNVYREKVASAWFDRIRAFKPEMIFISAGFDAHANDPLANVQLTASDYMWITQQISALARELCGGRLVSMLEGGYNLDVLAECVPLHINALVSTKGPSSNARRE